MRWIIIRKKNYCHKIPKFYSFICMWLIPLCFGHLSHFCVIQVLGLKLTKSHRQTVLRGEEIQIRFTDARTSLGLGGSIAPCKEMGSVTRQMVFLQSEGHKLSF